MKTILTACLTLILFALTAGLTAPAAAQAIRCPSTSPLSTATNVNQAIVCFSITPRSNGALRLDLQVGSGAYDLYVASGRATSLTDANKINVGAVSGALNYVIVNPNRDGYTVALVRTSKSGEASLAPVSRYAATSRCSGTTCTASYPLASMPGPDYGDQAIFAIDLSSAGRVDARADWKGSASLSALLYGPGVSRAGVTQTSLARKDGASPLALTYEVRSNNLIEGGKWSVGITNAGKAGGKIADGQLMIVYPAAGLPRLELVPRNIRRLP